MDFDTKTARVRCTERYAWGYTDPRCIYATRDNWQYRLRCWALKWWYRLRRFLR